MDQSTRESNAGVEIISNSGGGIGRWLACLKLVVGLGLAGSAGVWSGRAWSTDNSLLYLPGLLSLVCGAILAVSAVQRSVHHRHRPAGRQGVSASAGAEAYGGRAVPLLGELLVHKHHLLTEAQLAEALEEQRKRGGRLGQVLIAMGLLNHSELVRVLEDQLSYGDPWRETFAGTRRETVAAARSADG